MPLATAGESNAPSAAKRCGYPDWSQPSKTGWWFPEGGLPWVLDTVGAGTLESLVLSPSPAVLQPLSEGQVRVALRAGGVNFRDVLVALGMLHPGEARMGGEGAGVVVEVGPGVSWSGAGGPGDGAVHLGFRAARGDDGRTVGADPPGMVFRASRRGTGGVFDRLPRPERAGRVTFRADGAGPRCGGWGRNGRGPAGPASGCRGVRHR